MKTPFKYLTGNPHADEASRKAGAVLISPPKAGDWVCSFAVDGEPVAVVKVHSASHDAVSHYLNPRKADFTQDFFTFSA